MTNEENKVCYKCSEEKVISEFFTYNLVRGGIKHQNQCKECARKHKRQHYNDNKESIRKQQHTYQQKNDSKIKERKRMHYLKKKLEKEVAK